jgi:mono/diheme cytochrome c family protein
MTKKILIIAVLVSAGIGMVSCNKPRRSPGRAYMPDMYYSRAHETYTSNEGLEKERVNYTGKPVPGTVARGDMFAYTIPNNDSGYARSAGIKNPVDSANVDLKEAERLYLVYCGICHGSKLDGDGPLHKGGKGPFTSRPATLIGDSGKGALPPGTIFHVITYGKNAMGSYASQLTPQQRWMVVTYIKSKQGAKATTAATGDSTTVKKDSAVVKPN